MKLILACIVSALASAAVTVAVTSKPKMIPNNDMVVNKETYVNLGIEEIENQKRVNSPIIENFTKKVITLIQESRYSEAEKISRKFIEYAGQAGGIGEGFLLRALKEQKKSREYIEEIIGRAMSCRMTIDSLRQSLEVLANRELLSEEDQKALNVASRFVEESSGLKPMADIIGNK